MSKTARHKAILDLLDEGPVESQDTLQQRLERKGFEVGQATLSRDIHELKLVKGPEGYRRAGESVGAESVLPSVMHLAHQFVHRNPPGTEPAGGEDHGRQRAARRRRARRLALARGRRHTSPATILCWSSQPTRKKRRRLHDVFVSCRKRPGVRSQVLGDPSFTA